MAEIRREGKFAVGGWAGEQLVAVLVLNRQQVVSIIYVHPEHREMGHTRRLIERARADIAPKVLTHDNHYSKQGAMVIKHFEIPVNVSADGVVPPYQELLSDDAETRGHQALTDWAEVLPCPGEDDEGVV